MLRRIDPLQIYADVGGKKLVDAIKFCEKTNERYNRRYLARRRSSTVWHELGSVQQVQRGDSLLRVVCETGWVELGWFAPNALRVRLRTSDGNFSPPVSDLVKKIDFGAVTFDLRENDDEIILRSSSLVCTIQKKAFRLRLETYPDRRVVCSDLAGMQWSDSGDVRLSMTLAQDEACFGLGMRATRLNLRGKRFRLWNVDPGAYKRDTDPLFCSVPLYIGLKDDLAYGVFWDNPGRSIVELGSTAANELSFEAENGELRYYLIAGGDTNAVLARYAELTGRIEMPPLWSLGYGQAQFRYTSTQDLSRVATEFRRTGMLCETLYLDLFQSAGDVAQLQPIIAELHALQFKVIATIIPVVHGDDAAQIDRNLLLRYPDGEPVPVATWFGVSYLLDFSNPALDDYWTRRIARLIESGVDGLALELAEPTTFGASGKPETPPDYAEQFSGIHALKHNLYATQMAQTTDAALRKLCPEDRPVVMSHTGFGAATGLVWTGSNSASWDQLRLSIPMILNMNLSGLPLTGVNVGGYFGESDGELFTRWLQATCLLPLLRADSGAGMQPRQPWAFGQPYELINRLTLELRKKLLPYLYAQIALHREYGLPVVRPLFMAEPENYALRDVDDAFLVGDILVAPVLEKGASGRTLYLPRGLWYDYWTNEAIFGGQLITITAALERLPLFVRAGAVLPELRTSGELLLHIYPGDSENALYEDSGIGLDGESGNYRWVYVTCEWDEDVRFFISRRTAGSYQPGYKAIRVEVVGLTEEPMDVKLDRQSAPLWYYDNGVLELTAEDNFRRIEIMRRSVPNDRTITHRPW